ncbi:MAG: permease, partial [Ruminococcaceae bacterium]|nr:permease [Oscillospiraceae bacterium]
METYKNFQFSIFVDVAGVETMFAPGNDPDVQFSYYKKHLNFTKVYLECWRGRKVNFDLLMQAKDYFEARGVSTATAIMPCGSRSYESSSRMLCFTNPEVEELFSEYIASMGKYFGEIMIDDSLSTECTCQRCRAAKGDRSWTEFRLELMTEFCREKIVKPAKAVNPNVTLTLKYPTWHESFQTVGYNTETQPAMFDWIYTGTETRHTTYSIFRNPRYTSYSIMRYLSSFPPHNNRGGWFDNLMCANSANIFAQQAELTLMADPAEVTLFSWRCNYDTQYPPVLGYTLDRCDRFMGGLGAPVDIPVYLPYHSRGEDHVYDFFGMCGIPLGPVATFPED